MRTALLWTGSTQPIDVRSGLRVRGHCLEQENGQRWTGIECSDFNLFGRFCDGDDLTSILEQRAALGFNLLRVFTRYRLADAGIGDNTLSDHPDLYERLPDFLELVGSYGLHTRLTAYIGPGN